MYCLLAVQALGTFIGNVLLVLSVTTTQNTICSAFLWFWPAQLYSQVHGTK